MYGAKFQFFVANLFNLYIKIKIKNYAEKNVHRAASCYFEQRS